MEEIEPGKRSLLHRLYVRALWLARNEGLVLTLLVLVTLGTWVFAEIAENVMSGETQTLDERVIRSLRQKGNPSEPIGPHFLKTAALDATAMGGTVVLVLVTLFVGVFLFLVGKAHAMWFVWFAVIGGQLLSLLLKTSFNRPRPQVVPHLSEVQTTSFPSGHSMMSAVVYLTLGALLAQFVVRPAVRIYLFSVALFLTGMIGLTRIYLGVHYPTDVLAGWTAGAVWAFLCWGVAVQLQRRGKVEPPGVEIANGG